MGFRFDYNELVMICVADDLAKFLHRCLLGHFDEFPVHYPAYLAKAECPQRTAFININIAIQKLRLPDAATDQMLGDKRRHGNGNHDGDRDFVVTCQFEDDQDCGNRCPKNRCRHGGHTDDRIEAVTGCHLRKSSCRN